MPGSAGDRAAVSVKGGVSSTAIATMKRA
jgi:hypothetical protein